MADGAIGHNLTKFVQHLRRIVGSLDVGEGLDDDSVFVNEICGAHYAKGFFAIEGLLFPNVVGLDCGQFGVGKEREIEVEFLLEFLVRGHAIFADTDDFCAFFTEMGKQFRKCARLFCTTRSVVLGIEIKHNFLAAKLTEVADIAILVR